MKNLDVKNLCKQIRADRNRLIWSLYEGVHSVTNRHWMIKLGILPTEVLVTMLTVFEGQQPEENQQLIRYGGSTTVKEALKFTPQIKNPQEIEWTDYLRDYRNGDLLQVFLLGDKPMYVDKKFLLLCHKGMKVVGEHWQDGIGMLFFPEINYVAMPVRNVEEDSLLTIMNAKQ